MLGHATDFELPTECGTRVLQQWALDHQHLTPHLVRVVGIDIGFSRIGFAMLASTLCENPTDKSPVVVEYTESVDATTQLHRAVTLDELYRYHQHCVDPEIGPFFEKHSHSAIFREGIVCQMTFGRFNGQTIGPRPPNHRMTRKMVMIVMTTIGTQEMLYDSRITRIVL